MNDANKPNNRRGKRTYEDVVKALPEGSYWREAYEEAPELAKEYYLVNFAISGVALSDKGLESEAFEEIYADLCEAYYKMDDESWRYVLAQTSGPSKLGLGRIWMSIKAKRDKAAKEKAEGEKAK